MNLEDLESDELISLHLELLKGKKCETRIINQSNKISLLK